MDNIRRNKMARPKYNTIEEIVEAYEKGDLGYNSINSLSMYYKAKGNEERSQMYKSALKIIRKLNKSGANLNQ